MTDIFYSISPFGTGDIQTGAGNISISAGVATLSVAQTGNIGQGCAIEYDSKVVYISLVNSPTSFNVTTAIGGIPTNQSSVAVASIHHVFASRSDFEANYLGASFLNTTDLVTNTLSPFCCCYYDHDDFTVDSARVTWNGATTDATYFVTVFTPNGGYESINPQRFQTDIWDSAKYISEGNPGSNPMEIVIDDNMQFDGIQYHNLNDTGNTSFGITLATSAVNTKISNCIINAALIAGGIRSVSANATLIIENCLIYIDGIAGAGSEGIFFANGVSADISYCTIYNFDQGIERDFGAVDVADCIIFGNNDDFQGTFNSIDHCASDDGDGTNVIQFTNGTTDYDNIFTDWANGDFSLKDFIGANAVIAQGIDIPAITADIIGTTRPDPPSIGAFEFLSSGMELTKQVLDSIGVSDSVSRAVSFTRSIIDSVGISDIVGKILILPGLIIKQISDNIGIIDNVSRTGLTLIKSVVDSIGITDIVSKTLNPFFEVFRKIYVRLFGNPKTIIEIYGDPETIIDIFGDPL